MSIYGFPDDPAILKDAVTTMLWDSVRKRGGCLVYTGKKNHGGYGIVCCRGYMMRAHRLSWVAQRGPIPEGLHVLHSCDNPACVNIEHLRLGTDKDNMADCAARGRWGAKLSAKQVQNIRAASGTIRAIAKKYGVSHTTISRIRNGKRRANVKQATARALQEEPQ